MKLLSSEPSHISFFPGTRLLFDRWILDDQLEVRCTPAVSGRDIQFLDVDGHPVLPQTPPGGPWPGCFISQQQGPWFSHLRVRPALSIKQLGIAIAEQQFIGKISSFDNAQLLPSSSFAPVCFFGKLVSPYVSPSLAMISHC